jgi:GMP synthase (glutamine-hydrolysing)
MDSPPGNATWLASSRLDPHQAYRVGKVAWGVQFHPEFDPLAVTAYIDQYAELLCAQGRNPSQLRGAITETPHAEQILKRFATIVGVHASTGRSCPAKSSEAGGPPGG